MACRLTLSLAAGSIIFLRSATGPCAVRSNQGADRAVRRAPDKKSSSSVSSPIFACRVFTSMVGSGSALGASPNTPVAPSSNWSRRCLIWFGWTSNSCASSIMVFSPLIAAIATRSSGKRFPGSFSDPPHTLKAGLWFRRGRLAMVFSSLAASCRCCAENPLIPAVQIPAARSGPGSLFNCGSSWAGWCLAHRTGLTQGRTCPSTFIHSI